MSSRWFTYSIANIALLALIGWGALAYAPPIPKIFEQQDKLEHFLAFGAFMMWLTAMVRPSRWKLSLGVAILAAAGLEIAQATLTSSRSGDLPDFIASCSGILVSLCVILWARHQFSARGEHRFGLSQMAVSD